MRVDLFDYELPAERIAQEPRPRGGSRLLVLDRASGAIAHRAFADLPELLSPRDVLVRNDVRVRYARLDGRDAADREIEIFLLRPLDAGRREWSALARPARRAKPGAAVRFAEELSGEIGQAGERGERRIRFDRPVDDALLDRVGRVPLPPYIRRARGGPDLPRDREAYQTVFAREPLAVAAPTAGLHFTEEVLGRVRARGCAIADLTLAVGPGTFRPSRPPTRTRTTSTRRTSSCLPRRARSSSRRGLSAAGSWPSGRR